jgi:hypothetical protein
MQADTGWHFDDPRDPSYIVIHGDDCDRILEGDVERVDVAFDCRSSGLP